jgi:hypothetical protein
LIAGKSEVPAIVYKAGECMQELLKSWKEFEATQDAKNAESLQNGPTLEIRIPAEFVTSTNRQVKGAQLWGTDIYTNDSDLVAGKFLLTVQTAKSLGSFQSSNVCFF